VPFNAAARLSFGIMLESTRKSRERMNLTEEHQIIRWLTEQTTEKGLLFEIAKRRSWARNTSRYQDGKLYINVSKTHALARRKQASETWQID